MTIEEARKELDKFVRLKTTQRPVFVDVILEATESELKWIPCSERFPEKDGLYLVTGKWNRMPSEMWISQFVTFPGFTRGWINSANRPSIVAWMPLPELYKEMEE